MKYSKSYRERVVLDDGVSVEFRAIQPSDKAQLAAAFDRLSEQSRYRRFHNAKRFLSADELRFFTECDGVDHFAIVAVLADSDTEAGRGVGVARFVRSDGDPSAAELAIVVADDWQRRGIGRRLLKHIVAAASERGMQRIVAVTQADNEQIRGLLSQYADKLDLSVKNGETTISLPVPRPDTTGALNALFTVLRLVALGSIIIPIRAGELSLRHIFRAPPAKGNRAQSERP